MTTIKFFKNETDYKNALNQVDATAINALTHDESIDVFKMFRLDAIIGEGVIDNSADKAVCQTLLNKFPDLINLCEYSVKNKNTERETAEFIVK